MPTYRGTRLKRRNDGLDGRLDEEVIPWLTTEP